MTLSRYTHKLSWLSIALMTAVGCDDAASSNPTATTPSVVSGSPSQTPPPASAGLNGPGQGGNGTLAADVPAQSPTGRASDPLAGPAPPSSVEGSAGTATSLAADSGSAGAAGAPGSNPGGSGPMGAGGLAAGGQAAENTGGAAGTGGAAADGGASSAVGGTAGDGAGGTNNMAELVHYYGRWNVLEDRAVTVNSGSHVGAQFSGTGIGAQFDISLNQTPNPTLTWRIDDGEWEEGELAATMPLGSNLPAGTHDVTLMVRGLNENQSRWSAPLISSITFVGFEVTGGELEASLRPERLKIEFLGDSITEGVALWSSRNGQTTPCWRTDGRRAYASLTAQALGAEWRQVGFGRQGLLIDGNGGVPPANDAFNFFYADVPRDDWEPDLVVINQGTNDGGAQANDFRSAYAEFLTTIRDAYPLATIAAMRPFNGAHAAEISAEVQVRQAAGDALISYIDTSGWLSNADTTDGTHPNEQGSQKAAEALVSAIEAIGLL